jgi:hypothetical protein
MDRSYIADGYGAQYIMQYDANGKLLNSFGGEAQKKKPRQCAWHLCRHKIERAGLLITDRTRNCFKKSSSMVASSKPYTGACVCRPVIHGKTYMLLFCAVRA